MFLKIIPNPSLFFIVLTFALIVYGFFAKTKKSTILLGIGSWVSFWAATILFTNNLSNLHYDELRIANNNAGIISVIGFYGFVIIAIAYVFIRKTSKKIAMRMLAGLFVTLIFTGMILQMSTYIALSSFSKSEEDMPVYTQTELSTLQKETTYHPEDFLNITNYQEATFGLAYWGNDCYNNEGIYFSGDKKSLYISEGQGEFTIYVSIHHAITNSYEDVMLNFTVEE